MSEYDLTGATGATGAVPDRPDVSDVSFGEIVKNLSTDLSTLVRKEIELAKAEAKDEVSKAGQGAGMFAGAGVGALLMLIFLSLALTLGLDNFMGTGWAALIVGVLWAIVAGVLAMLGKKKFQQAAPPLQQTKDTLKEDARWAKTLTR